MISRRIFMVVSLVCLIPAMLGALVSMGIVVSSNEPIEMKVILGVGAIASFMYAFAAVTLFAYGRSWKTEEALEKERQMLVVQRDKFSKAESKLIIHLVREKGRDGSYKEGEDETAG